MPTAARVLGPRWVIGRYLPAASGVGSAPHNLSINHWRCLRRSSVLRSRSPSQRTVAWSCDEQREGFLLQLRRVSMLGRSHEVDHSTVHEGTRASSTRRGWCERCKCCVRHTIQRVCFALAALGVVWSIRRSGIISTLETSSGFFATAEHPPPLGATWKQRLVFSQIIAVLSGLPWERETSFIFRHSNLVPGDSLKSGLPLSIMLRCEKNICRRTKGVAVEAVQFWASEPPIGVLSTATVIQQRLCLKLNTSPHSATKNKSNSGAIWRYHPPYRFTGEKNQPLRGTLQTFVGVQHRLQIKAMSSVCGPISSGFVELLKVFFFTVCPIVFGTPAKATYFIELGLFVRWFMFQEIWSCHRELHLVLRRRLRSVMSTG